MDSGYAGARRTVEREAPWRVLEAAHEWNDLVLPDRELEVLRAVAIALSRRESGITEPGPANTDRDGTAEPPPGLRLLFAGDPGTGKTMAARALGAEVGRPILRVQLADLLPADRDEAQRLVTRFFVTADNSNAIPFLVASQSWLGRRSRLMRPHERRIAFEISGLLERVGRYPGLIIFASSPARKAGAVPADRFDFEVEFAIPDGVGRRRIWRASLPSDGSLTALEISYLAGTFELTGGAIRDCSMNAVARASRARRPVGLIDISGALHRHYGPIPDERTRRALVELRAAPGVEAVPDASATQMLIGARPGAVPDRQASSAEPQHVRPHKPTLSRRLSATLAGSLTLTATVLGFMLAQSTGGRQSPPPRPPSAAALPVPSASYATALSTEIRKLNAVRTSAGVALRTANNGRAQATAASALAAAYATAASALRRVSPPPAARGTNNALAKALATTAAAYRNLERSAANGDASGYQTAQSSLTQATAALSSAFAALPRLGYSIS